MTQPAGVKRVLVVLKGGAGIPSRFVRGLIYQDLFAAHRIDARYFALDSETLARLIQSADRAVLRGAKRPLIWANRVARAWRKRRLVEIAPGFDAIYLLKCGTMEIYSRLRRVTEARIVYDLNDAQWLAGRAEHARTIGLEELLRSVDCVTCDNEHTAGFARRHNPQTLVVPDPCQVELFDRERDRYRKPSGEIVIGWIGSAETARNLYVVWEALEDLFRSRDGIRLRLVGMGRDKRLWPPFEQVRHSIVPFYTTKDMIREVLGMHIGIAPFFDVEDSRVRGFLKASLYMSGEAAVVCSRIGECEDVIEDGVNGMLASTRGEWLEKLRMLISDRDARETMARRGLATTRDRFSLDSTFSALLAALAGESSSRAAAAFRTDVSLADSSRRLP